MGNKVPCKTGMLIYLPVTSWALISLQKEAVLSPCNFATTQLAFWIFISLELRDPWNGGPFRNAYELAIKLYLCLYFYRFNSPERRISNYMAFTFASFIRNNQKGGYRKLTLAHVRQAQRCVRCTFWGSFSAFSISKMGSDTCQNGFGCISDTYPNPYPPFTVPPLWLFQFLQELT